MQKGKIPPNECTFYDTKQSDCKAPVMLELWGMQSTPSLTLLPGSLWPGVVATDRILSMVKYNCLTFKLRAKKTYAKLNCYK